MRLLKTFSKIVIGITVVCIALLLFTFALFQNAQVKQYALEKVKTQIYANTGFIVQFQEVEGLLPLQIQASKVTIAAPDHRKMTIEHLHLVISPWDFFRGQLKFHLASLKGVTLSLPPSSQPITPPFTLNYFSIIPLHFSVDQLHITDLSINSSSSIHLKGSFELNPFKETLMAEATIWNQNPDVQNHFSLSAYHHAGTISAHFSLFEPFQGLLAQHFHLKQKTSWDLFADASGTLLEWQQLFHQETESHLKGNFKLISCADSIPHVLVSRGHFEVKGDHSFLIKELNATLHESALSSTPLLNVKGEVKVDSNLMFQTSYLTLDSPNLSLLEPIAGFPLKGTVQAKLSLIGPIFTPKISLELASESLMIKEYPADHFLAKADLYLTEQGLVGSSSMSCSSPTLPCHASAKFLWDKKSSIKLDDIQLAFEKTTLSGNLIIETQRSQVIGEIAIHSNDLSELSPLLKQNVKGTGQLQATFQSTVSESTAVQTLEIKAQGSNIAFRNLIIDGIACEGKMSFPHHSPQGHLEIAVKGAQAGSLSFEHLSLSTTIGGDEETWPYQFSYLAKDQKTAQMRSTGTWHLSSFDSLNPIFSLNVDTLDGNIAEEKFSIQQAVTLVLKPNAIDLSPLLLSIGSGSLFVDLDYAPEHLAINWDAKEIPLSLLHSILDEVPLKGSFNSLAKLHGHPSQLLGTVEVGFQGIKIDERAVLSKLPPIEGSFKATLGEKKLAAVGNLHGIGNQPIDFNAQIPFIFSLAPFEIDVNLHEEIAAHFDLQCEIAPLLKLLSTHTTSITGDVKSTLDIGGTFFDPLINGHIEVTDGSFESLVTGAVFKDIHAIIQGNGKQFHLQELFAIDGSGGSVTATGVMDLDSVKEFPFSIVYTIDQARILHLDYARAQASGILTYSGDLQTRNLSGELTIDEASVRIPEEAPARMHALNVTYVNHPSDETEPTYYQKKPDDKPIHFDVKLHVPRKAFLTGKNLTSEWYGEIAITGDEIDPLLNGELKVKNGKYLFNGKDFELHTGSISFAGHPALKTTLYISAGQDIEDIKVEVILKGPIKKPLVSFRSNPSMSQKEILSWILFNRGTNDITATQNAELSKSIITLSGGNSNDLLGKIRRSFGIDRIDLSSQDKNDTNQFSLRVGKYISRGLFLSINKSINSDVNQVAIEANITRNIKAQAEINDDAEGKMILKWQKDY